MNSIYYLTILIALSIQINSERTSVSVSDVVISWENLGSKTVFSASSQLKHGGGVSAKNAWLGIGLNAFKSMDGINAVICQSGASSSSPVRHHLNGADSSVLMSQSNPTLGLSEFSVTTNEGTLSCNFSRDNSNSQHGYHQITPNATFFLLVAYGEGEPNFHVHAASSVAKVAFLPSVEAKSHILSSLLASSTNSSTTNPPREYTNQFQAYIMRFINWIVGLFKTKSQNTYSVHILE